MPMVRAFFEKLIGCKVETGVDPLQCVAQRAAIHEGVLAGQSMPAELRPLTQQMVSLD